MIRIFENRDITRLNSFGVKAQARWWIDFDQPGELVKNLNTYNLQTYPRLLAGSGTNLLFTADFNGCIIHPTNSYIRIKEEKEEKVTLEAGAGLEWDELVEWTVNKGFYGLENLSLIPGSCGAAAVQNIGAYGAEIADTIILVDVLDLHSSQEFQVSGADCKFAYRNSIFKEQGHENWLVTSITVELPKKPTYNLSYGQLSKVIEAKGELSQRIVRDTVIATRMSKLPDHRQVGNAGSFFKNPVIRRENHNEFFLKYPDVPHFTAEAGDLIKIPAAWLIEKAGWKGFRKGDAGVYENQALVLVNHGNATGMELKELADEIRDSVKMKFGIELEPEVKIISR